MHLSSQRAARRGAACCADRCTELHIQPAAQLTAGPPSRNGRHPQRGAERVFAAVPLAGSVQRRQQGMGGRLRQAPGGVVRCRSPAHQLLAPARGYLAACSMWPASHLVPTQTYFSPACHTSASSSWARPSLERKPGQPLCRAGTDSYFWTNVYLCDYHTVLALGVRGHSNRGARLADQIPLEGSSSTQWQRMMPQSKSRSISSGSAWMSGFT